jgi:hypothetical protein
MNASPKHALRANRNEILRAIRLLTRQQGVYEIRALGIAPYGQVGCGYFDAAALDEATALIDAVASKIAVGFYITLNPTEPALLARAANRLACGRNLISTSDKEIVTRQWLPIDCDPQRPAGISSTDVEHQAALQRAKEIRAFLAGRGWALPSFADSGNGAHLNYFLSKLPNDDESAALIKRVLEAIDSLFSDSATKVDCSNFNAARIWKLYGTPVRKGDDIRERPHRLARILEAPDKLEIVRREQLEEIAALMPEPEPISTKPSRSADEPFDLERFIAEHGIPVKRRAPWGNGNERLILEHCLFDPTHRGSTAALFRFLNGAMAYKCHHDSCRNSTWHHVRELYEPGYRDQHEHARSHAPLPPDLKTVAAFMAEQEARAAQKALIQDLAHEGETVLIVGRAMSGKSTIACALVRCFRREEPFLGRCVRKAQVGYLALERNGAAVARLFERWGLDDVMFTEEVPPMHLPAVAQYLEQQITKHRLEVLVVDHLQNLIRVPDANDYAAVSNALEPFATLARRSNCLLILLHHLPKTRREDGEIDVMGSEAYRGAADLLVELTRVAGRHFIRADGRSGRFLGRTIVGIHLDTGEAIGVDATEADRLDAEDAILKHLAEAKEPITATQIRKTLQLRKQTIREALAALVDADKVVRSGEGHKGAPHLFRVPRKGPQPSAGGAGTESANDRPNAREEVPEGNSKFRSQTERELREPNFEVGVSSHADNEKCCSRDAGTESVFEPLSGTDFPSLDHDRQATGGIRAEALGLLARLKCFRLPAGRIPDAREIAVRLIGTLNRFEADGTPEERTIDLASRLAALRDLERELILQGGRYDPALAETVGMVASTFPDARLVEFRRVSRPGERNIRVTAQR